MSNPRAIKYRRLALAEPGKSAAAASPCRNRTRYPCYRRLAQTVAYTNRGVAFRNRGGLNRALADLNRAVELAPDQAPIYANRGLVHQLKDA